MDGRAISFGPFRLLAGQRLLLEGDRPVRLGNRAFDILVALVERAGEVIGKEQLIARAWPQTFVEASNLKIQVSALRRALGDGQGGHRYVVTVAGRGYSFVAPVRNEELPRASLPTAIEPVGMHNLPLAVTRMIGRDDAVAALVARLVSERLVTIVGPGGIGKTTVALAIAERMIADYEHGVWLVDLAPLGDSRLVPSAVATVLGLEIGTEDPLPGLVAALADNRMLLLLDNCEPVIEAAARLTAAVLGGAPRVTVLATSREPLGVAGERESRLRPLGTPPPSPTLSAAEALVFPAVQLFVERVTAIVEDFALTDTNTTPVVEICRKLDGLPLAIEFAAPRVEVLGVEGLAAHLDDNLPLFGGQRRAAAPRHQTMRAVLDWSYGLLNDEEQRLLRALGTFAGGFTVEATAAVALDPAKTGLEAMDRLADLVAKSLVVADVTGTKPWFRLLETTRAYAIEKLGESTEREAIARRHAQYYRQLFERAEAEAPTRAAGEWLADYAAEIDNLRAALDWAFSPGGDGMIGVALTTAAIPLWMRLSLLEERRRRAKQALDALQSDGARNPREEMRLHNAVGNAATQAPEMSAAFTKALEIAESLGDREYRLRALHGLYFCDYASGRYRAALQSAQKFHDLATSASDPHALLLSGRMIGGAKHFLGDQIGARHHLEQALARAATDPGRDVTRFATDVRMTLCAFLARVLWLQGFPDQAVRTADMSIGEAQAVGHVMSLGYALALAACPIALWVGNLTAAARYTEMLVDHSSKHGLLLLSKFASRFQRVLALRGRDVGAGSRPRRAGSDALTEPTVNFGFLLGLSEQAEALGGAGRVAEGLALLDAGIEHCEPGWLTPELLRLKGELLLLQSRSAATQTPEDLFRQALDAARRHQTLSWELRAATSLARLLRNEGRAADGIACLQPVYERFTEGFGTADLIAAKRLLDEPGEAGRS
ncbi:MAG TPA: winged helix-turn-helix domain-containing protein [Stellaceae bacterium]|nr:winged helix-turn-helix domain-containing protein [Stellaceae bacterium]